MKRHDFLTENAKTSSGMFSVILGMFCFDVVSDRDEKIIRTASTNFRFFKTP